MRGRAVNGLEVRREEHGRERRERERANTMLKIEVEVGGDQIEGSVVVVRGGVGGGRVERRVVVERRSAGAGRDFGRLARIDQLLYLILVLLARVDLLLVEICLVDCCGVSDVIIRHGIQKWHFSPDAALNRERCRSLDLLPTPTAWGQNARNGLSHQDSGASFQNAPLL